MQILNYTSVPSLSPLFLSPFCFILLYFFDQSCQPAGFIDFIVEPTFSGLIDTAEKVIGPLIEEERQAKESGNRRTRYYYCYWFSKFQEFCWIWNWFTVIFAVLQVDVPTNKHVWSITLPYLHSDNSWWDVIFTPHPFPNKTWEVWLLLNIFKLCDIIYYLLVGH